MSAPPAPSLSDGQLRRLHPLTPLVRGWQWFAAVAALATQQLYDDLPASALLLGLAALLALAGGYAFVSWRFTRYRFDGEDLRLETGVLFRRSRRVRLDRLQAVDVVRPLVARLLGLAELRLEVAGGGSAEAPLAYLSEGEAHRLRAELLARAAGLREDTPEAPERVLVKVPVQRILLAALLSAPVASGVVYSLGVTVVAVALGEPAALGALVPALLGMAGVGYTMVLAQFDFTVAESPDGLRIRQGLLETRAQTVPPGRIQAVRVVRPLLWRRFGWVSLEANIAGYGPLGSNTTSMLLPVGTPAEVGLVLARALPGVELDAVALVPAPRRARSLDPLAGAGLAVGADERVFVSRHGALRRHLDVVPHAKTQSVRWTQGPLQRRLGLATVHLDSTPGPVRPRAPHRDASEALGIVAAQAERARSARAGAAPERWMSVDAE